LYRIQRRIEEYALLARSIGPSATWLLIVAGAMGTVDRGSGEPHPRVLLVFVAGVFVMRAAGCVINDYADRNIDPHVRRTRIVRSQRAAFAARGFVPVPPCFSIRGAVLVTSSIS